MVKISLIYKKEFSKTKRIIIAFAIFFPFLLFGQNPEKKRITFGASVGIESSNIGLYSYWQQGQRISRIGAGRAIPGPSFGGFAQYPLTKTIVLRTGLNASFTSNEVNFQRDDEESYLQTYHFREAEMPLHFVLTNRKGTFPLRGSMILGARLGWNFANIPETHNLKLYQNRVGLDAGLGIEISLKKLRIQPEFLYSFGLNNQNDATRTDTYWGVGRTLRDRLTFRVVLL
jgi:hypothetical protein